MANPTTARRTPSRQVPRHPDRSRVDRRSSRSRGLAEGWADLSWTLRILRAFLGVTFLFAGAQKLLDPNFLRSGSADFIGTQLHGFAQGTPAGPLLLFLDHAPVLVGLGIAFLEIATGVGTLLGVAPIACAFAGLAISVTLWLSATWHVHPYFLGSDSVYAVSWLALLAGLWQRERARAGYIAGPIELIDRIDRRQVLRGAVVGGLTLLVAAVSKAFAGPVTTAVPGSTRQPLASGPGEVGTSPATTGETAGSTPGRTITTLDRLPVGKAIAFTAPGIGAAVLVRLATDTVVAYSRICTHAGCLVGYDTSNEILYCPCHGAEFDPAHGAQPIAGPAPTALRSIDIVVDPQTRKVILPA